MQRRSLYYSRYDQCVRCCSPCSCSRRKTLILCVVLAHSYVIHIVFPFRLANCSVSGVAHNCCRPASHSTILATDVKKPQKLSIRYNIGTERTIDECQLLSVHIEWNHTPAQCAIDTLDSSKNEHSRLRITNYAVSKQQHPLVPYITTQYLYR